MPLGTHDALLRGTSQSTNKCPGPVREVRILIAVRLFSGLESSVASGEWKPAGVPAIYKLFEALDRGPHELFPILLENPWQRRDQNGRDQNGRDRIIQLRGLSTPLKIIAGQARWAFGPKKVRSYLNQLRQVWRLWRLCRSVRPDVVYMDRANIWAAGLLARFGNTPVVMRMMGLAPGTKAEIAGHAIFHYIVRWLYRSPYALVICTQEGSDYDHWLDRIFDPSVPRKILLNGVDREPSTSDSPSWLKALPSNRTIVLFLGRLDPLKGIDEFVEGFLMAKAEDGSLRTLIIGTGSRMAAVRERIEQAGAQDFVTLLGEIPHTEVSQVLQRADIYVTLNRMGNLSNATLEAMKMGCCMIVPASQSGAGTDKIIDEWFPESSLLRIASVDDPAGLAAGILHLHRDPAERASRSKATREIADRLIPTWEQRLCTEIEILCDLV